MQIIIIYSYWLFNHLLISLFSYIHIQVVRSFVRLLYNVIYVYLYIFTILQYYTPLLVAYELHSILIYSYHTDPTSLGTPAGSTSHFQSLASGLLTSSVWLRCFCRSVSNLGGVECGGAARQSFPRRTKWRYFTIGVPTY